MSKFFPRIGCLIFLLQVPPAQAAVDGATCVAFIKAVGQDVSASESHQLQEATVYNAFCKDNALNEGSYDEKSASVAYAGIGIGAAAASGTTKQQMEHFCQTYDTKNLSILDQSSEQRQFSEAALRAFETCIHAAERDITIDYVAHSQGGVTVSFGSGSNQLKLNGFFKSDNLVCTAAAAASTMRLDSTFSTTLQPGQTFYADCKRTQETIGADQGYKPGYLAIGFGNNGEFLHIDLPADRLLTPITADEIKKKVDDSVTAIRNEIATSVVHECRLCMSAWGPADVCRMGPDFNPAVKDSNCTGWVTRGRSGTPRAEIVKNIDQGACNMQWELECR